jgi:hypothetical protein
MYSLTTYGNQILSQIGQSGTWAVNQVKNCESRIVVVALKALSLVAGAFVIFQVCRMTINRWVISQKSKAVSEANGQVDLCINKVRQTPRDVDVILEFACLAKAAARANFKYATAFKDAGKNDEFSKFTFKARNYGYLAVGAAISVFYLTQNKGEKMVSAAQLFVDGFASCIIDRKVEVNDLQSFIIFVHADFPYGKEWVKAKGSAVILALDQLDSNSEYWSRDVLLLLR